MKIVAVLSQKGGVGKTTLALHLAVGWTHRGRRVAVIDLDPQASAANWGARRVNRLPIVRSAQASRLPQERAAMRAAQGEIVVLDTAPRADAVILSVAKMADLVVLPCRPSILDLEALAGTLELVQTTGVPVLTVLNAVVPHTTAPEQAAGAIRQLKGGLCPVRIGRRVAFAGALLGGLTAQEYEPTGKAAIEAEALFQIVSDLVEQEDKHGRGADNGGG